MLCRCSSTTWIRNTAKLCGLLYWDIEKGDYPRQGGWERSGKWDHLGGSLVKSTVTASLVLKSKDTLTLAKHHKFFISILRREWQWRSLDQLDSKEMLVYYKTGMKVFPCVEISWGARLWGETESVLIWDILLVTVLSAVSYTHLDVYKRQVFH